jgi:hypothetical protein
MRAVIEQPSSQAYRGASGPQAGDGAGGTRPTVHDCCVKLNATGSGQHASTPGVEAEIFLEHANGGFNRIKGRSAFPEDCRACGECRIETGSRTLLLLGIDPAASHRSRAAMYHQTPA